MRFDNTGGGELLQNLRRNLPVFVVMGEGREARRTFMDWLVEKCRETTLTAVIDDGSFPLLEPGWLALRADLVLLDETRAQDYPAAHRLRLRQDVSEALEEDGELSVPWPGGSDCAADTNYAGGETLLPVLAARLESLSRSVPVWACILIGGKSTRMGRPKHLLQDRAGRSWLERAVNILTPMVDGLVVSGAGELPSALAQIPRLVDIPGVVGPLNGIIAATRWQPLVSWLILACDMPNVTEEAVAWLLARRRAGIWGVVPQLRGAAHFEPLFAWYDFRASHLFEHQLYSGNMRIGEIAGHAKIDKPLVPGTIAPSWGNINTPEQLSAMQPGEAD